MKVPTLVAWGRQDAIIPLNCGELYHRAIATSTLHVIGRCGHSPAPETPREFLTAALEFLARQS